MGKRKLFTGLITGAIVGGVVTLINEDARRYMQSNLLTVKSGARYYMKNPSVGIRNMRVVLNQFSDDFSTGTKSTLNALEQVESTLDKVIKNQDSKQKRLK